MLGIPNKRNPPKKQKIPFFREIPSAVRLVFLGPDFARLGHGETGSRPETEEAIHLGFSQLGWQELGENETNGVEGAGVIINADVL